MIEDKFPGISEYPFIVPTKLPYSSASLQYNNERIRTIVCLNCKYLMKSNMPDPHCGQCGREMITVLR